MTPYSQIPHYQTLLDSERTTLVCNTDTVSDPIDLIDLADLIDADPDLTNDRPTAVELLEIMGETLSESVVPATAPHAQHHGRVAANLCRILARQLAAETPAPIELPPSLLEIDDATAQAIHREVLELVRAKLDVAKPGYDAHGGSEEAAIIA